MNVHHDSIWPPPGARKPKHPAPAARHGALLQAVLEIDALEADAVFTLPSRSL